MNLKNEFETIRQWASEKGIYEKGDQKTQALKLIEEAGELAKAILKKDQEELKDAIGDCVVVLVNLSVLSALNFEDCVNSAYDVIKNRKGKMENGTFVKNGL
jgi:NTP pyrophosphatase (non-canonical NTP hydrolase)